MATYIDNDELIKELSTMYKKPTSAEDFMTIGYNKAIADVVVTVHRQPVVDIPEKNVGKWTEKEVIYKEEAKEIIEEWQSCRCSICGRYDTRPYMYYFDNPNFCSWCGAKMDKEGGAE